MVFYWGGPSRTDECTPPSTQNTQPDGSALLDPDRLGVPGTPPHDPHSTPLTATHDTQLLHLTSTHY